MMWYAFPLATPWDYGDSHILTEPSDVVHFAQVCRACMGLPQHPDYPLPKVIQAQARLNDALAGRVCKVNGKRVWTFPKLIEWYKDGAVFDTSSFYLLARADLPVETDKRHIQLWSEKPLSFVKLWRTPGWHLTFTDWKIVCPTSTS